MIAETGESSFEGSPLIIVADDVAMNMTLIISILKQLVVDAEIVEATNGRQVVEITEKIKPDLILMDVQMPVMDGLEATIQIRAMEAAMNVKSPVPIIALSAGVSSDQKNRCLSVGMNEFLAKPVERASLFGVLSQFLTVKNGDLLVTEPPASAAAAATSTDDHFDMQGLIARTGVDKKVLAILARNAAESLSTHLRALTNALSSADAVEIKRAAHTIKGVSLNLSFTQLAKLARQMELEMQSQNIVTDELKKLYSSVCEEVDFMQRIFAAKIDTAK